eukprot:CAMPEP_0198202216 /NCGR_PEP_ID=MMETSP1445-20131203/5334_1 /TAXON_ID=36898 /ORGANISM="Pyramimonas sp., Strain CCMP2087" /LENGTH=333 /DNA_ID=CAMNT_0043873019 /DNA_START=218 /DNA_END=1219 /DNA_ORIENTATION=-
MAPRVIAVVSKLDHPSLATLPVREDVKFLVANDMDTFLAFPEVDRIEAIVWVVPGDVATLEALWEKHQVKWIHSFSAGVDPIQGFLKNRLLTTDTIVTNGRSAFSSSLAEYTMAAALHFNKQVPRLQANKQAHKWENFVMPQLNGKTMGFLGFGDIAKATAKMAKEAFGMRVLALRRNTTKIQAEAHLVDHTFSIDNEKLELFKQADFVVCILPGTTQTQNFVSTAEFAAMKPDAIFISIGRGAAVDEAALEAALKAGTIAGAALDVFKKEPLAEDHPLWTCPNLLLSSHNADFTADYFPLGWSVMQANLEAFSTVGSTDMPYLTVVDKTAGY